MPAVATLPAVSRWPLRTDAADPRVLLGGLAVGLVAAGLVPGAPGVGWPAVAVASAIAVCWAARRLPDRPAAGPVRLGWAGLAIALAVVPMFSDAGWLCTLCVLTAGLAGALAVIAGRGVGELLFAVVAVPAAALCALPWVGRCLRALRHRDNGRTLRLAGTLAIAVLLLVVFGALFAGADATFARLVTALLPSVHGGPTAWSGFAFVLFGLGVVGACYLVASRPDFTSTPTDRRRVGRLEWALPVGVLVLLFCVFVGVQVVALFGGGAYVQQTAGLTYAQYARSGFWQLAAVTVLTLVVVGVAAKLADPDRDRAWLRWLLGALALLTLVIVASALSRMWSYQQAYGFTVLRLLVESCELWLGLVYVLVLVAGVRMRARWLPAAALATGMAALLVLATLNPDGFVAQRNLDRWQATGRIDVSYLAGLSPDAIGAANRLPDPLRDCVRAGMQRLLAGQPTDWRSWNASRSYARSVLGPVDYTSRCPEQDQP